MQFANPLMFLTLSFIPILILIHALKSKPRQIEVTNLFLWQEVIKERTSHITLTRLKKNLPLLLQIVLVCLAALALAFDCHAERISAPAEVRPALERAFAAGKPAVVEVMVEGNYPLSGSPAVGWWDVPVPTYLPEKRAVYDLERREEQ